MLLVCGVARPGCPRDWSDLSHLREAVWLRPQLVSAVCRGCVCIGIVSPLGAVSLESLWLEGTWCWWPM